MNAGAEITPCLEKPPKIKPTVVKLERLDSELVKPWLTAQQMTEIAAGQRVMSWAEKKVQINRSLGRPLDSD